MQIKFVQFTVFCLHDFPTFLAFAFCPTLDVSLTYCTVVLCLNILLSLYSSMET